MLYEVAVIQKPTVKERESGELEKLLIGPVTLVASDERSAALRVTLDHAKSMPKNLASVEVLVRPFN